MFKLNNMKAPAGSNAAPKRKGRGVGSGTGKTSGRGHKGDKARSGGGVPRKFEGGQMPLQMRVPKIGFNSPIKLKQIKVSLSELGQFSDKDLKIKDLMPRSFRSLTRVRVSVYGSRLPKSGLPKSIEAHRVSPATAKILADKGVAVQIQSFMDGERSVRPLKKSKKQA